LNASAEGPRHAVRTLPNGQTQLFIALHLIHEVTSPQDCRAFAIDGRLNGADLADSALTIHPAKRFTAREIRGTARIGIDYAGPYVSKPWRFFVQGERAVSG
jgi:3-methyladenine DNA glycosylase Mpg